MSWSQESVVNPAIEESRFEAEGGEAIALGFGDALDQSVQAQAGQVVAPATKADWGWGDSEQLRKQWPQLTVAKALGLEAEQDQHP